jgi:hypothetical protein
VQLPEIKPTRKPSARKSGMNAILAAVVIGVVAGSNATSTPCMFEEGCEGLTCTPDMTSGVSNSDWTLTFGSGMVFGKAKAFPVCTPCLPCQAAVVWDYDGDSKWKIFDSTGLVQGQGSAGGVYRFSAECDQIGDSWQAFSPNFWGEYTSDCFALLVCRCP